MRKEDLKTGMVVKMDGGELRMVMGGGLMGLNCGGGIALTNVNNDLSVQCDRNIIEVYSEPNFDRNNHIGSDMSWFSRDRKETDKLIYTELIWERKVDELTLEQVCKELGREIKIIEG
jgi:hypothetical protein